MHRPAVDCAIGIPGVILYITQAPFYDKQHLTYAECVNILAKEQNASVILAAKIAVWLLVK